MSGIDMSKSVFRNQTVGNKYKNSRGRLRTCPYYGEKCNYGRNTARHNAEKTRFVGAFSLSDVGQRHSVDLSIEIKGIDIGHAGDIVQHPNQALVECRCVNLILRRYPVD